MYSLWNEQFYNIESYTKHGYPKCTPMTFYEKKRGLTDKFKLEELDALTTQFKNKEDFVENLLKHGQNYISNTKYCNITMTHSRGNKIYQDDIIYGDLMINEVAREIMLKKKNKEDNEIVLIDESEKITEFIEYIKGLALNKTVRKYLIEPLSVTHLELNDMYVLDKLVDSDVVKDDVVIKKGLKGLLKEYIFATDAYKGCLEANEDTLEVEMDLEKINKKINKCIISDYRVFRNLIAWENRVATIFEKITETTKVEEKKVSYLKVLSEIKIQKKFRNNLVSVDVLNTFYGDLDYMFEEVESNSASIENDELESTYEQGGIEEVMNNYDLDDIYGSSKNYESAIKLGIIKGKK